MFPLLVYGNVGLTQRLPKGAWVSGWGIYVRGRAAGHSGNHVLTSPSACSSSAVTSGWLDWCLGNGKDGQAFPGVRFPESDGIKEWCVDHD